MKSQLQYPFVTPSLRDVEGLERYRLLGDIVTLLISSEDAMGQFTLHEVISIYREGVAMRTHIHPEQTQYYRVLAGALGYQVADSRGVAYPGEIVVMPAGIPHRTWTAQPGESRSLVLTTPGGLDDTIRRFGEAVDTCARPTMDLSESEVDEICEQMLASDTSVVPQMCE